MSTAPSLLRAYPSSARRRPIFRLPFIVAVGIALIYPALQLFGLLVAQVGDGLPEVVEPYQRFVARMTPFLLAIALGVYGFSRGSKSPLLKGKYGEWLRQTPWRAGLPLPLGPAVLVWEDLIPIAVTCAEATYALGPYAPLAPLLAFGIAYSMFGGLLSFIRARLSAGIYLLFFGWPGVLLAIPRPMLAMALTALLLILNEVGVRRALRKFPWHFRVREEGDRIAKQRTGVRWTLGPHTLPAPIPLAHGLLISAWIGWSVFCATSLNPSLSKWGPRSSSDVGGVTVALVVVALLRWACYCLGYRPPITLWGRLQTGRLIIPGYDYVQLAVLGTLLTALLTPIAFRAAGCPPALAFALATTLTLGAAINIPPTIRRWRLTGHHRIWTMNSEPASRREQITSSAR